MNKHFFFKRLFTIVSFILLTGIFQTLIAQTRTTNKIGREGIVAVNAPDDETTPRISAERTKYAVGENAVITGQGFDKFERVSVSVEQTDVLQKTDNLLATWTIDADENGNVNFNWYAPFSGSYNVKAVGSTTNRETQTSFVVPRTVTQRSGNPNCKDFNPNYQEFKIDPPRSKTYQFAEENYVAAKFHGGEAGLNYVDFQSTIAFSLIIVKGGTQSANIYSYNPRQDGDNDLTTPNLQDISHVTFCYEPKEVTTAAPVSVSGYVLNANGRALSRSLVTIQNLNTEETRTVVTSSFGYYRFNNLPVGNLYTITISNKKAGFIRQTQSFVLNNDMENFNFTATAP